MGITRLSCFVFIVLLVLLVEARVYESNQTSEVTVKDYSIETKSVGLGDLPLHHRQKRGYFSFFVAATSIGLSTASSIFQLVTALSDGCAVHRSICDDKAKIIQYEKELNTLGKEYEKLFHANQWKYLNLKLCMINNKYVLSYIDDQFRKIDDIGLQTEIIATTLATDLKTIAKMFASNESAALENIAGPFNHQLESIIAEIKAVKENQIVGLVIQRSLDIFLKLATDYVDKVIKHAKGYDLAPADSVINRLSSDNSDLSPAKQNLWKQTKDYFKKKGKSLGFAIKAIGTDVKTKFTKVIPRNIKKWWQSANKWSTFKEKVQLAFLGPTSTITKIKNFFRDPIGSIKYAAKHYEFKKGRIFLQGLNIIVESIQTAIVLKKWDEVAKNISDTRKEYEKFIAQVKDAMVELKNETMTLNGHWSETIRDFKSLVSNFTNITTLARENNVFADVAGLAGLPVDTSDAFFSTDFNVVTEQELKPKQEIVKDFFKKNRETLSSLLDKFKVQQILVSDTKELALKNKTVAFIYDSLKRIFKNYDSGVMKNYSSKMEVKDVVCSASLVLPDRNQFDYYPTDEFRETKCEIPDTEFSKMQLAAARKRERKILIHTVQSKVPEGETLTAMLDLVKGLYNASTETNLQIFGTSLKEIDIVCEIATLFTNMNSYKFYDLTPFRPECSNVTQKEFNEIKGDAVNMEKAKTLIKYSMEICRKINNCNCPSAFAQMTGITKSQIHVMIDEYKKENNLPPSCHLVENTNLCTWQCQKNAS